MHHVYVMSSQSGPTKVGISKSLEQRLIDIRSEGFGTCEFYLITPLRNDARKVELFAHDLLASKRVRTEWFDVSPTEAAEAIGRAIDLAETGVIKRPKEAATRKARQRANDRAAGLVEILVKVHKSRVADMREVEIEMRTPKPDQEETP